MQGVSTRKVKAVTEELCGHAFSASAISAINKRLDEGLAAFAGRRLEEPFAYLILDARYEKVREAGIVGSRAVQVAVGIDREGRRQVLAVELANRESRSSWKDFLLGLKERGLHGVEFVVADDHAGLQGGVARGAARRLRPALLRPLPQERPRPPAAQGGRRLPAGAALDYDRRELAEAKADLAAWLKKWGARYDRLTSWVEENIEETFTYYRLPRQHHKHMKSTNMLERLNEEIKRRTRVVRIFPNAESCLRLVRALAVEAHENWLEANRYLNMDDLREQKKLQLREAA